MLLTVEKQGTYLHVYGSSEAALVLAFYINCPTLITKLFSQYLKFKKLYGSILMLILKMAKSKLEYFKFKIC